MNMDTINEEQNPYVYVMHRTIMIDTEPHMKRTISMFVSHTIYFVNYPS